MLKNAIILNAYFSRQFKGVFIINHCLVLTIYEKPIQQVTKFLSWTHGRLVVVQNGIGIGWGVFAKN